MTNRGLEEPFPSQALRARRGDWDSICGLHQGRRPYVRRIWRPDTWLRPTAPKLYFFHLQNRSRPQMPVWKPVLRARSTRISVSTRQRNHAVRCEAQKYQGRADAGVCVLPITTLPLSSSCPSFYAASQLVHRFEFVQEPLASGHEDAGG